MPDASPLHRFTAHFAQLHEAMVFAGQVCTAAGMTARARHRVELVLEEAFSNSIHHGYLGECDQPIWLALTMLPDGLRLVFQDAAPPFDPLQSAELPSAEQVGGVGRVLIKTLPRRAVYALQEGRNTLTLDFGLGD